MPICGSELTLGGVAAAHAFQPVKGQAFQAVQRFVCCDLLFHRAAPRVYVRSDRDNGRASAWRGLICIRVHAFRRYNNGAATGIVFAVQIQRMVAGSGCVEVVVIKICVIVIFERRRKRKAEHQQAAGQYTAGGTFDGGFHGIQLL